MTGIVGRMKGYETWQRQEAVSLRKYSKSPCMPELAEMHEETADVLKDARIEIERLRVAVAATRREGIEAAIEIVERTISSWSIAASEECAAELRALLEDGR